MTPRNGSQFWALAFSSLQRKWYNWYIAICMSPRSRLSNDLQVPQVVKQKSAVDMQIVVPRFLFNLQFTQTCSAWDRNNNTLSKVRAFTMFSRRSRIIQLLWLHPTELGAIKSILNINCMYIGSLRFYFIELLLNLHISKRQCCWYRWRNTSQSYILAIWSYN